MNLFFLTNLALASFSFSVPQTSINEDQEIEATINLSIQNHGNEVYYLEGAFKKEGASNYFGLTWNNSNWVSYSFSNNDKNLKSITTNPEGSWSGVLKTKLDTGSSQFQGSGNYILKINRFTDTGSNATPSDNTVTLSVAALATPTLTETQTPSPTSTPTNTPTPTATPTKTVIPTKKPTATPTKSKSTPTPTESSVNLPQSILGASASATETPTPTKAQENSFNFMNLVFIAGGIILILLGIFAFTFVAKGKFKGI